MGARSFVVGVPGQPCAQRDVPREASDFDVSSSSRFYGCSGEWMRQLAVFICALMFAASARAHAETIEIDASARPIIEVFIGDTPARLEVIPDLPDSVIMNPEAAERYWVQTWPTPRTVIRLTDGDGDMRLRFAREHVRVGRSRGPRILVAPIEVSDVADGVIALASLPADVVTFRLRPDAPGDADSTISTRGGMRDFPKLAVGGVEDVIVGFDFRRGPALFSRSVARRLDASGHIAGDGEVTMSPIILGLSAMTQPVSSTLSIGGLPVETGVVRTDGPLVGPSDMDEVMVGGTSTPPRRRSYITLGRDAIEHCSTVSVNRDRREITFRCSTGGAAGGGRPLRSAPEPQQQ